MRDYLTDKDIFEIWVFLAKRGSYLSEKSSTGILSLYVCKNRFPLLQYLRFLKAINSQKPQKPRDNCMSNIHWNEISCLSCRFEVRWWNHAMSKDRFLIDSIKVQKNGHPSKIAILTYSGFIKYYRLVITNQGHSVKAAAISWNYYLSISVILNRASLRVLFLAC